MTRCQILGHKEILGPRGFGFLVLPAPDCKKPTRLSMISDNPVRGHGKFHNRSSSAFALRLRDARGGPFVTIEGCE